MATPVTTPEMDTALDTARNSLAAALSGNPAPAPAPAAESPSPAPPAAPAPPPAAPTPAPAPTPAAAPKPAEAGSPSTPPATPTPAPAAAPPSPAPATATPEITDPAAKRYLDMHKGDQAAALAHALRDNNRLAQIAREHPELFRDGAPADPRAVPENLAELPDEDFLAEPAADETPLAVPPPPEVVVDTTALQHEVDRQVLSDSNLRNLMATSLANDNALAQATSEIQKLASREYYLNQKLQDPHFDNEVLKGDVKDELRQLRGDLQYYRGEESRLKSDNRAIRDEFNSKVIDVRQEVYNALYQQGASAAEEKYYAARETAHYHKFRSEWPGALDRVIAEVQLPPSQADDFRREAKGAALLSGKAITNLDAFLRPIAQAAKERLDRYHREQSAIYGQQAHDRAAAPAPIAPAGGGAPPAPQATTGVEDLESVMDRARTSLQQRMRR